MLGFFGDYGTNMYMGLISKIEASKKQRLRDEIGISSIGGYEGIERLNIPHKYNAIKIGRNFFECYMDDKKTIYNNDGKFLFECTDFKDYKYGMFLVGNKSEEIKKDKYGYIITEFGYSLYNEGHKMTDPIFKPSGMSECFNEFGYAVVGCFGDWTKTFVIKKSGEIILTSDSYSDTPNLKGVICSIKYDYTNLLTGEHICTRDYSSTIETDEFIFAKVDKNCVYQISKNTGDFIVHGVIPVKEEPKKIEPVIVKKTEPLPKKQNRNEICNCGSGKKYKFCCINK